MGTVRHTDAVFRAAEASGLRVTSGNALMDDPSTNPPYLFAETEEALAEGERLFARWHGRAGGRLRFAWCPRFAVSCTDRILREAASRARAQGVLVHTHASENRDEVELVRARSGRANIEHLRDLGIAGPATVLAHVIHTNEEEQAAPRRRRDRRRALPLVEPEARLRHLPRPRLPRPRASASRSAPTAPRATTGWTPSRRCATRLSCRRSPPGRRR